MGGGMGPDTSLFDTLSVACTHSTRLPLLYVVSLSLFASERRHGRDDDPS